MNTDPPENGLAEEGFKQNTDMYDLGLGYDRIVDLGTTVLLDGPAFLDTRSRCLNSIKTGVENDEQVVIITFDDRADYLFEAAGNKIHIDTDPVTIIDCVSKQHGLTNLRQHNRIKYCGSPENLTDIGIKLSETVKDRSLDKTSGVRIILYSLSTAFVYTDSQAVFIFLNEIQRMIQNHDAVGIATVNSRMHDDRIRTKAAHMFDEIIAIHHG